MINALYEKVSTDQSNLQHPYRLGLAHTVAETANQIKVTLRRKWTKSMMFKIITVNEIIVSCKMAGALKPGRSHVVLHFVKVHCCSAKVGQGKVESLDLSPAML